MISGVESEIREALINLVFNAIDAMPEGGTVGIRTRVIGPGVADTGPRPMSIAVEVQDSGIGMDDDTRRRCLEPFFTTKGERGTGLGLAMVYGVMTRHNAEIEIDSQVNHGTTVRLCFAPLESSRTAPLLPDQALPNAARLRILIVDDDPLLLKSLRDTLELDGHQIVSANMGQMGIDTFRKNLEANERIDVVITDLGMPYVDGRKVSSAIKAMSPATPVIMLTGWGQRLVAEGDIPAHVDCVLNKPPKLKELRGALARLLAAAKP